MKKILKQVNITLLLVAAICGGVYLLFRTSPEAANGSRVHTVDEAKVKSIRQMVRLCVLDMYEETGIKDTINGKGLFAIQRLRGTVSFDVENLRIDTVGLDSLRVYLPPERVEWLESTDSGSYRVVDVWNVNAPLFKASLTAAEENELKRRAVERAGRLAVEKGYVARARKSAVAALERMFAPIWGLNVEVVDTVPPQVR